MNAMRAKFSRPSRVYNPTRFSVAAGGELQVLLSTDLLPTYSMRFPRLRLAAVCFLSLAAASCKKEKDTSTPISSREYWPLAFGRSVTYAVDSTVWDDFDCSVRRDTTWLRYTVADSFMNIGGSTTYAINVDARTDSSAWRPLRTFSVTPSSQRIEVVDAGLRFIKLIDPVVDGNAWNGNAYINTAETELQHYGNWNYRYEGVGASFNTGYRDYDNTISVPAVDEQQNDPDDVSLLDAYSFKTLSKEVYAKNVGLVYREMTRWIYDPNIKRCRRGFAVVMRATENN